MASQTNRDLPSITCFANAQLASFTPQAQIPHRKVGHCTCNGFSRVTQRSSALRIFFFEEFAFTYWFSNTQLKNLIPSLSAQNPLHKVVCCACKAFSWNNQNFSEVQIFFFEGFSSMYFLIFQHPIEKFYLTRFKSTPKSWLLWLQWLLMNYSKFLWVLNFCLKEIVVQVLLFEYRTSNPKSVAEYFSLCMQWLLLNYVSLQIFLLKTLPFTSWFSTTHFTSPNQTLHQKVTRCACNGFAELLEDSLRFKSFSSKHFRAHLTHLTVYLYSTRPKSAPKSCSLRIQWFLHIIYSEFLRAPTLFLQKVIVQALQLTSNSHFTNSKFVPKSCI